jgi:hypothetical protein
LRKGPNSSGLNKKHAQKNKKSKGITQSQVEAPGSQGKNIEGEANTEGQNVESNASAGKGNTQVPSPIPGASYVLVPPIPLTTGIFDLIFPGLNATYGPNSQVALHCYYDSSNPPMIQSIDGSSSSNWNVTCQVWVNNASQWTQAIVFSASVIANVTVQMQGNVLTYTFNIAKVNNLVTSQSVIGNVNDQEIQNDLNILLLWPQNIAHSIKIPLNPFVQFNNAQASFRNGYLEVLGDLNFAQYNP